MRQAHLDAALAAYGAVKFTWIDDTRVYVSFADKDAHFGAFLRDFQLQGAGCEATSAAPGESQDPPPPGDLPSPPPFKVMPMDTYLASTQALPSNKRARS